MHANNWNHVRGSQCDSNLLQPGASKFCVSTSDDIRCPVIGVEESDALMNLTPSSGSGESFHLEVLLRNEREWLQCQLHPTVKSGTELQVNRSQMSKVTRNPEDWESRRVQSTRRQDRMMTIMKQFAGLAGKRAGKQADRLTERLSHSPEDWLQPEIITPNTVHDGPNRSPPPPPHKFPEQDQQSGRTGEVLVSQNFVPPSLCFLRAPPLLPLRSPAPPHRNQLLALSLQSNVDAVL